MMVEMIARFVIILATCYWGLVGAAETSIVPWNLKALSIAPKMYEDSNRNVGNVKAIFYEGLPWKGKATRVFAYYAVPKGKAGEKVPAMVLVHGGGGSAFIPWVQLWLKRGYAAISMDTCGCISGGLHGKHSRHKYGGPAGWGGFDQVDQKIQDQWTYHAVADVILAHSLIRSFPRVDAGRIGITGISWGGYLTCIVSGIDHRFKFAVPVYGCGFLGDNSVWLDVFKKMGRERADKWLRLWDPSVYLVRTNMPMLWVDGTNDFAYPMDSLQKSYRLTKNSRTLCLRVRMPHGHGGAGENPEEIHAMADVFFMGNAPLVKIVDSGRSGSKAWVRFESRVPVVKAELNYTLDLGKWQNRKWQTKKATLNKAAEKASAILPDDVKVFFFNIIDKRNLVVSSDHVCVINKVSSGL